MIQTEAEARSFVREFADQDAMERLDAFIAMLAEENERQNLVANASLAQVWQRHIADSAQLLAHVSRGTSPWLDLGTGAGPPGIIIAILRPDWEVHLVESRAKRIDWLQSVAVELALPSCHVIGKRLELVESFPVRVISARAFAPLPRLLDLSARFSTEDTTFILPKGRSAGDEVRALPKKLRRLFHVEPSLTGEDAGIVIGKGLAGQFDRKGKAR